MVRMSSLFVFFLYLTLSMISSKAEIEFAKFHLFNDFVLSGRPSNLISHKVVFAIKQNTDNLDSMLLEVSDPSHEKYGHHLTRDQVSALTSIKISSEIVHKYLQNIKDILSIEVSTYGEYITVIAPIIVLERLFNTIFFKVTKKNNDNFLNDVRTDSAVRALQCTLPLELKDHVVTVFNTIQTPIFKRNSRNLRDEIHPDLIAEVFKGKIRNNLKSENNKIKEKSNEYNHNEIKDEIHLDLNQRKKKNRNEGVSIRIGLTYPQLLNDVYNIFSNEGSSTLGSQGVFASAGQILADGDLTLFQKTFGLPLELPMDIGGHMTTDTCVGVSDCAEANLDVQYMMGMSQDVPTTFWYTEDESSATFMNWVVQVSDLSNPPKVFSVSYGIPEHYLTFYEKFVFDTEIMKLGLQGVTILAAAGDSGVAGDDANPTMCGYNPDFPASSPYVLAVGATQGPEFGLSEISCSTKHSAFTSGGGFSNIYQTPIWQQNAVQEYFARLSEADQPFANSSSTRSSRSYPYSHPNKKGRGYPDVSLLGVNYVVAINGTFYPLDGTSTSVPVMAAMVSLVNSARLENGQPTLGYLNPALYFYANSFTDTSSEGKIGGPPSTSFPFLPSFYRDIIEGDNRCLKEPFKSCCQQGFTAGRGWDPVSGFGSIDYQLFYDTFMATTPLQKSSEQSVRTSDHNIPKNILSLLTFFIVSTMAGFILVFVIWMTKNIIFKCFYRRPLNAYSYVHIKNDYGSTREINHMDNVLIQERNNELI